MTLAAVKAFFFDLFLWLGNKYPWIQSPGNISSVKNLKLGNEIIVNVRMMLLRINFKDSIDFLLLNLTRLMWLRYPIHCYLCRSCLLKKCISKEFDSRLKNSKWKLLLSVRLIQWELLLCLIWGLIAWSLVIWNLAQIFISLLLGSSQ
jgi:hypothetical protein